MLTLICSWLSMTLGRFPEVICNYDPKYVENLLIEEPSPLRESIIQQEMANIGVINIGILRDVFIAEGISLVKIRSYMHKISHWLENLPPLMRINSLLDDEFLTLSRKRSTLLLHLNHLGALMLLHRHVLFYLARRPKDSEWDLDGSQDE